MGTMSPAAAASCGRSKRRTPPVPKAAPWLVIPYGKGMRNQAFYNISEPNNRTYRKSIPELNGKSFWQKTSHEGWLVVLCKDDSYNYTPDWIHGDCFLWNPASLENIQLPSLLEWINTSKKYVLIDSVLSSPPPSRHEHDHSHDSMVLFLFGALNTVDNKLDHAVLLFCHPGDKQWRLKRVSKDMVGFLSNMMSIHYFKNKLYVMLQDALLEITDEQLLDDNIMTLSLRPLEITDTVISLQGGDNWSYTDLYYLESGDEIFKILISYSLRCYDTKNKEVMSIGVWRLDFSLMKWEEVNDLGDRVIFVSNNTRVCCSASNTGLAGGCLYYTLPEDQSLYKFDVNSTNHTAILPCPKLQTPWFPSNWVMIMPNDGQKSLEHISSMKEREDFRILKADESRACTASNDNNEIRGCIKHNKEETNHLDILNLDMLALIASYLHGFDYLRLRSVSRTYRRIMPIENRASILTGYPYSWLVFPRDGTYNLVNPEYTNETYFMNFCELLIGATIRCQKDGWLLMSKEKKVFFYNPFVREIINLPDLPERYNFSGICFDSIPTSPKCAVFAIDQRGFNIHIFVTMRGSDSWEPVAFPNIDDKKFMPICNTPIWYKNVLYCLDYNGTLGAFDLFKEYPWSVLPKPSKQFDDDMHPCFLVECGGDLLLVKIGHLGSNVRVLRLDVSEMEWVKVESLGKYMLFISYTSCVSAIAPNSHVQNRIYFPRLCLNGEGILFYSLETGSYHSSGRNQHSLNNFYETEGWLSNCTWIEPNWSRSTPQELEWFKPQ